MANNNNETTTKFKVDISELKKAMQDAKRQIAVTNSEFKAISSSMDDWTKSTDGLQAKVNQLDSNLDNQKRILRSLEDQLELTIIQYGEGSAAADNLRISINKQQSVINGTEKELQKYNSELAKVEQAQLESLRSGKSLEDVLNDVGEEAEDASGGFTIMKGALAGLVADGIRAVSSALKDLVTDSADAYAQFSASTGIATEAMGEYEDAIKSVYKNNFGESLADVASKMARVKEVTGELDASKLQDMTEKAITLEDVFGMDMTETLRGVQSLMTHFGMSSEEAFDYLASGAQNGLNYTDELGDNISEYAGKFAEAGYTAEEYFQLLQNGSDGGAYNLDKVNDAINEVTARLADGTIGDAIGMFSSDTQDLFTAWQNGEATQKQVIDSITNDIRNTTGEQEKMNLAAKAFGTMAEDGGTMFIQSLSAVGDTYDNVQGKADELANTKYDTPMAALQGIGRTLKVELLQPLVDKLMPYLNELADWITANLPTFIEKVKEMAGKVKEVIGILKLISPLLVSIGTAVAGLALVGLIQNISTIGGAIKTVVTSTKLWAAAQWLLNAALNANIITLVIVALVALAAGFAVLWNKSEAFRNFWIGLWENIKTAFSAVGDFIVNFFTVIIPETFSNAITAIGDFISSAGQSIMEFFTVKIPEYIQAALDWFNDLPYKIGYALGYAIASVIQFGIDLWNFVTTKIPEVINGIVKFFSELPAKLWTWLVNTIAKIIQWRNDMKEKATEAAKGFIENAINFIKELPSKVWTWLQNTISKVSSFASDLKTKGAEAAKNLFNSIVEGITSLPDKVKEIGSNIVKGLWNGIDDMVGWITGKIESFGEGVLGGIKDFFGIHSPSKVMEKEVGKFIPAGIAVGIDKNAKSVLSSMKDLTTDAVVSARSGLSSASGSLSGGSATGGVVNNFYQTNNSPKALSRLEIYRQSKNLLGYAGGV